MHIDINDVYEHITENDISRPLIIFKGETPLAVLLNYQLYCANHEIHQHHGYLNAPSDKKIDDIDLTAFLLDNRPIDANPVYREGQAIAMLVSYSGFQKWHRKYGQKALLISELTDEDVDMIMNGPIPAEAELYNHEMEDEG